MTEGATRTKTFIKESLLRKSDMGQDNHNDQQARGPPAAPARTLDEILRAPITPETPLRDFMLVAGLRLPSYQEASGSERSEVIERYRVRRQSLTLSRQICETNLYNNMRTALSLGVETLREYGDAVIRGSGCDSRFSSLRGTGRRIGRVSYDTFGTMLAEHGLNIADLGLLSEPAYLQRQKPTY